MKKWALGREKFWQFFSRKHLSVESLSEAKLKGLGTYARSAGRAEDGRYIYEVANGPFFALFNVGPYTFSPFKVAWPMGASKMRAAVLSQFSFEVNAVKTKSKCVIPATGTTSYVSFDNEDEAHYLCAALNSTPVDAYIRSFSSAGRGFGAPSVVSKFNIPGYSQSKALHRTMTRLSMESPKAAAKGRSEEVAAIGAEIDRAAAKLWGITDDELRAIQEALAETGSSKRAKKESEDSADDTD